MEAGKAAEEKRRLQKEEKARLDESLAMKRASQMRQEQDELAFDRKILEQLLAQSKAEQQQESQRKVCFGIIGYLLCDFVSCNIWTSVVWLGRSNWR